MLTTTLSFQLHLYILYRLSETAHNKVTMVNDTRVFTNACAHTVSIVYNLLVSPRCVGIECYCLTLRRNLVAMNFTEIINQPPPPKPKVWIHP